MENQFFLLKYGLKVCIVSYLPGIHSYSSIFSWRGKWSCSPRISTTGEPRCSLIVCDILLTNRRKYIQTSWKRWPVLLDNSITFQICWPLGKRPVPIKWECSHQSGYNWEIWAPIFRNTSQWLLFCIQSSWKSWPVLLDKSITFSRLLNSWKLDLFQ